MHVMHVMHEMHVMAQAAKRRQRCPAAARTTQLTKSCSCGKPASLKRTTEKLYQVPMCTGQADNSLQACQLGDAFCMKQFPDQRRY